MAESGMMSEMESYSGAYAHAKQQSWQSERKNCRYGNSSRIDAKGTLPPSRLSKVQSFELFIFCAVF